MPDASTCGSCNKFCNDPAYLEQAFPGLTILNSGRGAVRAADGLCSQHGLYLSSTAHCGDYQAVSPASTKARRPRIGIARFLWLVLSCIDHADARTVSAAAAASGVSEG